MSNQFPLKHLNLLGQKSRPSLVKATISINNEPFHFYHPEGDQTMFGTLSCLSSDKFRFRDVGNFNPGDVLIDIGSNIGLVGMVIAKMFPQARIFAFDASDIAVECARMSAAANGLINYQAYQVAVGASRRKGLKFFSNGSDKSCLVADGLNKSNPVLEMSVDMISIDDIFDSPILNINNVRYMKMDIEGGEFEIFDRLFSQRQDILDKIEFLHLEVHPYQEYNPEKLVDQVKSRFGNKVFFDV